MHRLEDFVEINYEDGANHIVRDEGKDCEKIIIYLTDLTSNYREIADSNMPTYDIRAIRITRIDKDYTIEFMYDSHMINEFYFEQGSYKGGLSFVGRLFLKEIKDFVKKELGIELGA